MFLILAEEPFLIMADHHEIRKLSVDGSNYTILKQVSDTCVLLLDRGSLDIRGRLQIIILFFFVLECPLTLLDWYLYREKSIVTQ